MRWISLLLTFGMWIPLVSALECQSPALLKQADGKDDTLHSWCELNGVREGVYEVVSLKKGLEIRAHYKNDKLDGRFQRFSENNILITDGTFTAGAMAGEWTRNWTSGKIRDRGTWKDDRPIGRWQSYNESGRLDREVTYDVNGKIIGEEKPIVKPKEKLVSADRWRLRVAFAHTSRDHGGDTSGPAVGADRRVFGVGRWLRADLDARVVPDKKLKSSNYGNTTNNNYDKVYSGQLAMSFDLFPNLTDPVVLYGLIGVHFVDFDKARMLGGLGLRYHFTNSRQNCWPNGLFAELSHAEGGGDSNTNNQSSGPGPGNNTNNNQEGGSETLSAGLLWSFF